MAQAAEGAAALKLRAEPRRAAALAVGVARPSMWSWMLLRLARPKRSLLAQADRRAQRAVPARVAMAESAEIALLVPGLLLTAAVAAMAENPLQLPGAEVAADRLRPAEPDRAVLQEVQVLRAARLAMQMQSVLPVAQVVHLDRVPAARAILAADRFTRAQAAEVAVD